MRQGIEAVIVYPINALVNSQYDDLARRWPPICPTICQAVGCGSGTATGAERARTAHTSAENGSAATLTHVYLCRIAHLLPLKRLFTHPNARRAWTAGGLMLRCRLLWRLLPP
jgi:hypothetical protein